MDIPCICPPNAAGEPRHASDEIELRERLDFAAGRTARNIIVMGRAEGQSTAEIMTALSEWYVIAGIRSWSVVDAKGKPVEPNRETIRQFLLDRIDTTAAEAVADAADELYSEAVITPLVVRASNSSPPTPTNGSTSATNGSSSRPPKRSKPSSTTTTPTGGTATTSNLRAGGSSSSPSSA